MDFHALQRKLFSLDPTDPTEDLRKLQQIANAPINVEPTKDYLNESVNVPQGALPLAIDSIADFAKLAGVQLNEKKQRDADQVRGNEPMPKAEPGRTKHPFKDRLVGEGPLDSIRKGYDAYDPAALEKGIKSLATGKSKDSEPEKKTLTKTSASATTLHPRLVKKLEPYKTALEKIFTSERELKRQFFELMKKADPTLKASSTEGIEEANAMKTKLPKERDPSWQIMQAKRSSGAMGAHRDKKRDAKMGRVKHKKDYAAESIKDRLWAALNNKNV